MFTYWLVEEIFLPPPFCPRGRQFGVLVAMSFSRCAQAGGSPPFRASFVRLGSPDSTCLVRVDYCACPSLLSLLCVCVHNGRARWIP